MTFLPKTTLGKWSIALIIAMPLFSALVGALFGSYYEDVPAGESIAADIVDRPFLAVSMLIGMASGLGSFVTGLLSIVKRGERSILVFISTVIGGLLLLFITEEIISPHD